MKLLKNTEDNNVYLTKSQWRKVFLAVSIMTIVLYVVAMVFSLLGSKEFILNYQNDQMDKIQNWLVKYNLYPFAMDVFMTIEFSIAIWYLLKKTPKWYYVLSFYAIPLGVYYILGSFNSVIKVVYPFIFYFLIFVIERFIKKNKISIKRYLIDLAIVVGVTLLLQGMILVIKAGYFDGQNHIMNLSATFIYALEYDIALSVILYTISLYAYREKGDNIWATSQAVGGSSQTSTTQSQKSYMKNLTKLQKNKLRRLYVKLYVTQLGAFLIVMILPFLLGKVFEFLVMYLSFAIVRYILGFKYSLHFKKESICITVGAVVFGILSLVVPFFYAVVIAAILMGVGLAILLHLSYKYKGMVLFNKVAKPDKFATLYVFFDGNLTEHNVKKMCCLKGLDLNETNYVWDFVQ